MINLSAAMIFIKNKQSLAAQVPSQHPPFLLRFFNFCFISSEYCQKEEKKEYVNDIQYRNADPINSRIQRNNYNKRD